MTAFQYQTIQSDDVNDHAASLSRWDQQYDQVAPGRFDGRLQDLWLGPVQVFRESTSHAVLQRGAPCPSTLTLAVPVGAHNQGWFCGRRLDERQAFGLIAGGEFELATRGNFDIVAVGVDRDFLDGYSQRVDGVGFVGTLDRNDLIDGSEADNAALRELLLATLGTAADSPKLLEQEPLRKALVHSLCDALIHRFGRRMAPAGAGDTTAATRQRVVREARRYMSTHAEEPITVPDLCEAIHVSRRTLQYSFQDVLQMSPVTYLRALRLNGVRRDLRRGGDEPVADRAARWGFWHLSRFAADYRHMFGELPSETLRHARGLSASH
ncbi:helix-turn-helix domain-containing protein [Ideonella sp. A 288]|uniref:helix-turn-helix domain-containing protein n=1 Tax=Ideonella sp. A 288 TaxID=1962181 RepID=UPI00130382A5|nr:helix-turn-helix domain-containing protein [Ideonella sp. A 288]